MKLDNLEFQIKHTTGNMLTANQQSPYQHCPQGKSHLSGSSSLPGHSQLMAEPSNSGGIQAPENFSKYKGSKVTFWPRPASTWVNLVDPPRIVAARASRGKLIVAAASDRGNTVPPISDGSDYFACD